MKRIFFLLAFCFAVPHLVAVEEGKIQPRLSVSGQALLKKPADLLNLSAGVVSQDKEAQKALKSNTAKVQALLTVLTEAGLQSKEYATGHFQIRPIYNVQPPRASLDWQPSIVAYEVSNSIDIQTEKLADAGHLVDALNQAGANNIQVNFGLKDPNSYRTEAIRAAATRAIEEAKTLAEASGVQLVQLLEVTLDHSTPAPFMQKSNRMLYAMETGGSDVPLVPGEIEVKATVDMVYSIR